MRVFLSTFLPFYLAGHAAAKAILGVDLGSLYMKVALVQRNSPLEIVTNLHSKRKTEQMVLFDRGSRFYGADASSLMPRKPLKVPQGMSVMLGRDEEHPTVQVLAERHYPLTPSFNETRSGVTIAVDDMKFTPEELVAMVLSHAKDITTAYGAPNAKDCVLTVPSFFTQHERRALLDAAELADLNVLGLIDETTAAALHYGIDRVDEKPVNILFYNMGGSSLQVSIVTFHSYEAKDKISKKKKAVGSFEVKGKAWDATLGGNAFDSRLVGYFADTFNENAIMEGKDIRDVPRAVAKLRVQANKVKHVLSANNDIPVFVDGLYKDTGLSTHVSRAKFEELTHDLLERSVAPIQKALDAANMTLADIDQVELIGGGMRIPKVQEMLKSYLGESLVLGMHINSDEAMALGAAFHGANVSTAFRVRQVGMTDVNPFAIGISLHDLDDVETDESGGFFGFGKKKKEAKSEDEEEWTKSAKVFKNFGKIGIKKTIAFTHDRDVHCSIDYEDDDILPTGTEKSLVRFKITGIADFSKEMKEKDLGSPKVSLQFELTDSGLTELRKAEAVLEETVIVQEEVEVEDEEAEAEEEEAAAEDEGEEKTEDKAATEEEKKDDDAKKNETDTKKKKKKMKKIMVDKEKKKVHRRTLKVETYYTGKVKPYSDLTMTESKAKLQEMARKDHERLMLEEAKNKYESMIYYIRNKMSDDEEAIAAVSTEEQRTAVLKNAEDAEEWMYDDGYTAGLETYNSKYEELAGPAEAIFFRLSESKARPEAIKDLNEKLVKIEELMTKWETSKPQVTEEDRANVAEKVENVRKWIVDQEEAQAATNPWDEPAFKSTDAPKQTKDVEALIGRLSKKPKPKPKKEEKKENKTEATDGETEDLDDKSEAKAEETPKEETEDKEEDEL